MVQMVVGAVFKGGGVVGGFASLESFSSPPPLNYISEFYIILLSLIPQIRPLARK